MGPTLAEGQGAPLASIERPRYANFPSETGVTMPLSEHEQRILAEIEQQLAAEDPKFVARARRRRGWPARLQRRIAVAMGAFGVFLVLLLGFVSQPWNIISAALGLTMVFGAILLAATATTDGADQDRVGVPPDERS